MKDSEIFKNLYKPTSGNWIVITLLNLVFIFGLFVSLQNFFEVNPKPLNGIEPIGTILFLFAVFILSPLYFFRLLTINWLSEVDCNSETIRLKGLLFKKTLIWENLKNISLNEYRGNFSSVNFLIIDKDNKSLKFSSAFGPIGGVVFKTILEYRPDLVEEQKKLGKKFEY